MHAKETIQKVKELRLEGKTYREIMMLLSLSKATISDWCRKMELSEEAKQILKMKMEENLVKARATSLETKKIKRVAYFDSFYQKNKHYGLFVEDPAVAKVALAMLYAGEGAKGMRAASIRFGNSDPLLIKLFVKLFKVCYQTDPAKFRCVVQCRADQDTGQLTQFWYNVTGIPLSQFRKPLIDPRTVGKPTIKVGYKGVCCVEYYSSVVFFDLMKTIEAITGR